MKSSTRTQGFRAPSLLVTAAGIALSFACSSAEEHPGGAGGGAGTQGLTGGSNGSGGTANAGSGGSGGSAAGGIGTSGGAGGAAGSGSLTGGSAGTAGSTGGGGSSAGSGNGGSSGDGAGGSGGSGGTGGTGDCTTPPPPSTLVGWASEGSGTTGGGNATPVVVTNADELADAIEGTEARVIHVSGSITGSFGIGSNKSVVGICGAEIHGHIGVSNASNVILRNLKVVGNNCSDSPTDCSGGADAITIGDGSHHVWVDHLDVSDGSDGNLDITGGANFVTVSWTKFSYSTKRSDPDAGASGHRFSNLIGSSDTDERDPGKLNVTYHHCWWAQNVDQRMPRSRRGQIHVFNNLYTATGNSYCTNAGQDAKLLVQNNLYAGVNNPLQVSQNGTLKSEGNDFTNSTGNKSGSGNGFTPPYDFDLDATSGLQAAIQAAAGPK